jgi:hypothetical protein
LIGYWRDRHWQRKLVSPPDAFRRRRNRDGCGGCNEGASAAAAVADLVDETPDHAPYDAGDVIAIDQLAGSDWLKPVELDALELTELEQLSILSDFCHPKRAAMQDVLGPIYRARELAHQSAGQWRLREAGLARLRALQDAERAPPAPAADRALSLAASLAVRLSRA